MTTIDVIVVVGIFAILGAVLGYDIWQRRDQ